MQQLNMYTKQHIRGVLSRSNDFVFAMYVIVAAFLCYTGMYAFRKAISAALFEGIEFWGIDYKILLVFSQVIGYALSKLVGVKVVSELAPSRRAFVLTALVVFSGLSLLAFPFANEPYGMIFLFLNGLPIGMIYGILFNYLEGRRLTEIFVIGLIATQVFSSGLIKATGKYLMLYYNVSEVWMPFLTGMLFFPFFVFSVWMLEAMPMQDNRDILLRSKRTVLKGRERTRLLSDFALGIVPFIMSYILLTSYRDYRDNFAADIWNSLGFGHSAGNFLLSELPITGIVIIILVTLRFITNNFRAMVVIYTLGILGAVMITLFTFLYDAGMMSPFWWVSLTGMGLYITYVLANSVFFERLIAVFKVKGNAGFLIILADFFGYCGSVAVMFVKNFSAIELSHKMFFEKVSLFTGIFTIILWVLSGLFFLNLYKKGVAKKLKSMKVRYF
jgi:hypothetical protein